MQISSSISPVETPSTAANPEKASIEYSIATTGVPVHTILITAWSQNSPLPRNLDVRVQGLDLRIGSQQHKSLEIKLPFGANPLTSTAELDSKAVLHISLPWMPLKEWLDREQA